MLKDRNLSSHLYLYEEDTAEDIFNGIKNIYYFQMNLLAEKMDSLE